MSEVASGRRSTRDQSAVGEPVVEMRDVVKRYGAVQALDGLSLTVGAGTVTALLGPNGAGKTTVMEIMTGLRIADSGTVQVLGLDPKRARVELACRLGVQVQEFNLQATVQVRESLSFFASLHANPEDVDELLGRFGLADKAKARFPTLSGGQKRRLAIAKALVGRPEVVVLDEPTSGLDPQGQQFLRVETRRLREEGRAVVISTHDVEDAARLADHVIVVDHGRVAAAGAPARVVADHCRKRRLVLEGAPRAEWSIPDDVIVIDDGNQTILYGEDRDTLRASAPGAVVLEDRAPTLHDAYFLLTGTALRS